jgi:hypothetical protein
MEPPGRSTTQLGDWYINLVMTRKHRLLLFVSETTFLPVVIKVSELVTIVPRFRAALAAQLEALGLGAEVIAREIDDDGPIAIAKTASRQVLGVMTDMAFQAKWELEARPPRELRQLSLRLSETPFGPLRYAQPAEATRALVARGVSTERAW